MSLIDQNPDNTARINIVDHNEQIFANTTHNDLVFFINSEQNIHIGPYNFGGPSVFSLNREAIKISGNLEITGDIIARSNYVTENHETIRLQADQVEVKHLLCEDAALSNLYANIVDVNEQTTKLIHTDNMFSSNLTVENNIHTHTIDGANASFSNVSSCNFTATQFQATTVQIDEVQMSNITASKITCIEDFTSLGKTYFSNVDAESFQARGDASYYQFLALGTAWNGSELYVTSNVELLAPPDIETFNVYWGQDNKTGLMFELDKNGELSVQPGRFGSSNILRLSLEGLLTVPNIRVDRNLTIGEVLEVRDLNILERGSFESDLAVQGSISISNNAFINKDLTVDRDTLIHGKLDVDGEVSIESNVHIKGYLDVSSNTIFSKDIHTSTDVLTASTGYVFMKNLTEDPEGDEVIEKDAVAFIHDEGVFVGGHLHVNVDLPEHKIHMKGDMRLDGPSFFEGLLTGENDALFLKDVRVKHDFEASNVTLYGNLYAPHNALTLENDLLSLQNLQVNTHTLLKDTVDVDGQVNVTGDLIMLNNAFEVKERRIHGENIIIQSNADYLSDINVQKDANIYGDLFLSNNQFSVCNDFVTMDHLRVEKTTTMHLLDVQKNATFFENMYNPKNNFFIENNKVTLDELLVNDNARVKENLYVESNVTMKGKLFMPEQHFKVKNKTAEMDKLVVMGHAQMLDTMHVNGAVEMQSNVFIKDKLTVQDLQITRDTTNEGSFEIKGDLVLLSNLYLPNQRAQFENETFTLEMLYVKDSQVIDSNLTVKGDTSLEGSLSLSNQKVWIQDQVLQAEDVYVTDSVVIDSNLTVKGDTSLEGALSLSNQKVFVDNQV